MSQSLRFLSDSDILSRTQELTRRERAVTLQVLVHLNEIDRRKLHLREGYSSLFDYCTKGLGYSESAANRRIRSARCVARFPEVGGLLDANEANVSTVSQVSRILTEDNKAEVLTRMRNKSQREVEALVAEHDPRAALPGDRVQTVVMRVPVRVPEGATSFAPATDDECKETYLRNGGDVGECTESGLEHHFVVRFSASEGFMNKIEKIKSLASHKLSPNPSFEQVFELAMDSFLEKHDPSARRERREQQEQKTTAQNRTSDAGSREQRPHRDATGHARYVPARVRDQVFLRDKGQCSFISRSGRHCGSTHVLQIDHIQPVARGGASTADNLRLLCAYHNRLECERLTGRSEPRGAPTHARS